MAVAPQPEGPTSRRPFSWRAHIPFALLALVAGPALVAFAWQHGVATIGDDSVSYLALAQHIAPGTPAIVERWVGLRANFPPLFPLALALAGGAHDLLVAHGVVAAFAIAALVAMYAYATLRLRSPLAGALLAALFLATPNAWVSMKGILSEPMFLAVSLAALLYHARRLEAREGSALEWLAFGVLLACAYLTRAAAVALVLGYAAHATLRAAGERGRRAWRLALPALPLVLLVGAWLAWRPGGQPDAYRVTSSLIAGAWVGEPLETLRVAVGVFLDGWVASFLAASDVAALPRAVFVALLALGAAGSARAALRNRLDGWYVLASLAITFGWVFSADNTRRLFYPVVPLLMVHGAELALALAQRVGSRRVRAAALAGLAALPAVLCLPAAVVLAGKALDRAPFAPGAARSYADCVDYYTTIPIVPARAQAAHVLAVLEGFDAIAQSTPPGSRVMWMRPEYVAILGHREGVPYLFSWDERRLARELLASRVDFLVVAAVFKTDDANRVGDPSRVHPHVAAYTQPVLRLRNPVNGAPAFLLVRVDRDAVRRFLAAGPAT